MRELTGRLWHEGRFARPASYQRFGYFCAALLVISGLVHFGVFLVDGGPWEGPVSWRKPVVFGLSFGITILTLTWFLTFFRIRKTTGWIVAGVLGVASLGEVFLISMQKWRGVASHFNETTTFDGMVFSLMGLLVMLIGLTCVFVTVRAFLPMDASPSLAWAIRIGLLLMLVSQAIGGQMIAEGGNTFGAAGSLKLTHAVTLHAIQVLPAMALLLGLSTSAEERRVRVVWVAAGGYACIIGAAMMQTYGGHRPFDLSLGSSLVAVTGLTLLLASGVAALRGLLPNVEGISPTPQS
jgi:hypothetical protein